MKSFYAIKRNQLHTYNKNGKRLFVTRLLAEPLSVVQVKTVEKDKYCAIQVGLGSKKRANKPLTQHTKVIARVPKYLKEIRLDNVTDFKAGDSLQISSVLALGDVIKVTSISKGKGFAGGMKRHGFHGGPKTHGQSDRERAPGSIGQGTSPGRIWKGKRMAGHMGNETISVLASQVVKLDEQTGELWITGTVPGGKNSLVELTKMRDGKFVGLIEKEVTKIQSEKVEQILEETPSESITEQVKEQKEVLAEVKQDSKEVEINVEEEK